MFRDDGGDLVSVRAAGGVLCRGEAAVRETTSFDLASLTKPFVASAAARMASRGQLDFGVRVDDVLPDARGTPLTNVTLEDLLAHQSGLDAWGGLYLDVQHEPGSAAGRGWVVGGGIGRDGDHNRGMVYSDLGYIVAGELIAKAATGAPLTTFRVDADLRSVYLHVERSAMRDRGEVVKCRRVLRRTVVLRRRGLTE